MSILLSLALAAFIWGCVSAVSLPVGAMIGVWIKPSQKVTSSLMAFGAGALLFALTIELFGHSLERSHQEHDAWIVVATIIGALSGGVIFELLNRAISNQGGFLRKSSLLKKEVLKNKVKNDNYRQ